MLSRCLGRALQVFDLAAKVVQLTYERTQVPL
jgi:hypothetical protein